VALLRTDVSEELSASFTLVLTRDTRRNIPEDAILHSHRRENLKSYISIVVLATFFMLTLKTLKMEVICSSETLVTLNGLDSGITHTDESPQLKPVHTSASYFCEIYINLKDSFLPNGYR
jgi:hypothetical protein